MGQICANSSLQNQGFHSLNSRRPTYKGPFIVKDNQSYILKELIIFDSFVFSQTKQIFEQIQSNKNKSPYILSINEYWVEEKDFYCQNSTRVTILLENYKRDLEAELQIRQSNEKHFSDNEIIGLCYSVLKALKYLISHDKNYFHGFLNLNTIVLSQNGQVKLMEGRVLNLTIEGNIKKDFKDLALILMKAMNLDSTVLINETTKTLKNEKFKELIEELIKGEKELRDYLCILKKIQKSNKTNPENKENTLKIEENYLSFGEKSNFVSKRDDQTLEKPEIKKIIKENLNLFSSRRSEKINIDKKITDLSENTVFLCQNLNSGALNKKTKVIYEDGSYYEGEIHENLRHGKGTFVFSKGGFYKGEWHMGKMGGFGVLYYTSGKVAYEGEWKNDAFEGRGAIFNEDVDVINGKEVNYKDFGKSDNAKLWKSYSGDFKKDKKNGVGTLGLEQEKNWLEVLKMIKLMEMARSIRMMGM